MDDNNKYSAMPAFIAGALIGAGLALLLAPQTGHELRGMLGGYASRKRDKIYDQGREAWDTTVQHGKEYVESGKEALREAGKTAREYMESGKEPVKEAGKEIGRETPKRV